MSTTLPLFWHLSSASKKERIDSSVKLIGSLELFQAQFVPKDSPDTTEDDEEREEVEGDGLDALNAQDVSYSVRRLVRGLASPRESSRLGFAVALTELLSRINTVTCAQIVALILDSSKTQGSASGQEERDVLFARLFGFTSVIKSGLLLREVPLPTSASSSPSVSSASSYNDILVGLVALGEKKSWLRESAWWTIGLAVDALGASEVSWRNEALGATIRVLFEENKLWTPEKVALALKLQKLEQTRDWRKLLSPTFKQPDILSTGNLSALARILKEASTDDDHESDLPKSGSWKAQVHFVWDMLLEQVLSNSDSGRESRASFPEFFRIVVDESLFSSTSSPERKYWGFQIFQKAFPRVSAADLPMLFTKNFMRSWINHLSNSDRYLHKIARQVVSDIQTIVKSNPTIGFTLILQLTGVHGSHQFDKLTKTKTVESILTSMDNDGIKRYIDYLLKQVNDEQGTTSADAHAVNTRRAWIIDQLAALVRNGAIPKSDDWIQLILDWLAVNGLFVVTKRSGKSPFRALHSIPVPAFSDDLRKSCRERLLSCLAELIGQSTVVKGNNITLKAPASASDGELWVSKVLLTIERLETDSKHVSVLAEADEDAHELRQNAHQVIQRLQKVTGECQEAAQGATLLLSATLVHHYCTEDEGDSETLQSCIDGASGMFPAEPRKGKKSRQSDKGGSPPEPVDILVDIVIGFLEEATAYMRAAANQVFSMISGSVQESTLDLILAQLERRDPAELIANEEADDEVMDDEEIEDSDEDADDTSSDGDEEEDDDDEDDKDDADDAEGLELRKKIEEALRINGIEAADGDSDEESDEELMDDDQMMAIDEHLAAVFRARAGEKKGGKDVDAQREATHFKNRVLDLLETFIRKQPTSPLIIRLILPLVDLVVSTGPDEKQLADKATGILRSRIGKSKEVVSALDIEQAATVLEELHTRARTASSADVAATISQCSLYVSKALHNNGEDGPILKAYRLSLTDFVTRKTSRLNASFFHDLLRRHPVAAWGLRDDFIQIAPKAVNLYRQCRCFQLVHTMVSQLPMLNDRDQEILAYMPTLRQAVYDVLLGACGGSPALTPAQTKELLKLPLTAARQTRRISHTELATIWEPQIWTALAGKLAASDRFKSSANLQSMCKQMAKTTSEARAEAKGIAVRGESTNDTSTAKRKAGTLDDEGVVVTKTKRKKVKKSTS